MVTDPPSSIVSIDSSVDTAQLTVVLTSDIPTYRAQFESVRPSEGQMETLFESAEAAPSDKHDKQVEATLGK